MHADGKMPTTVRHLRQFGLIMAGLIALFFGLLIPWIWSFSLSVYPFAVSIAFLVPALVRPTLLGPAYRGWMWFGEKIGWFNQRLILAVLFFFIFTPTSLVLKLLGRDPMRRRFDAAAVSYRVASVQPDNTRLKVPY